MNSTQMQVYVQLLFKPSKVDNPKRLGNYQNEGEAERQAAGKQA